MTNLDRVNFYGDVLDAVRGADGRVWVSLLRCCENLGVDGDGQRRKLQDKPWATTNEMLVVAEDGKHRGLTMIDLDTLSGWLFSIDARKVKAAARDKLVRYQKEAAKALTAHFFPQASPPPAEPTLLSGTPDDNDPLILTLNVAYQTRMRQLETERRLAATQALATRAMAVADAAARTADGNLGYFSVLGYCNRTGREVTTGQAAAHGRKLGALCRAAGVDVHEIADPRFGRVNTYPESILRQHFGDLPAA